MCVSAIRRSNIFADGFTNTPTLLSQIENMNFRSPHLLDRENTALLVVDVQKKLMPVIENCSDVVVQTQKLVRAASILGVPIIASEQYPAGLGPTIDELDIGNNAALVAEKRMFSCRECNSLGEFIANNGIQSILICGVEAHVCVAQTAFDYLASGLNIHIAIDAVGSRHAFDRETALQRMSLHGISLTTTESAIFELTETAESSEFKDISKLLK